MGAPSIKGHQGQIKLFQDGGDTNIVDMTEFSANQDSTFSRTFYVGRAIGEGDQTVEGWSGNLALEVKGAEVDDLIDGLIQDNLNGIGVSEYSVIDTELYSDGTSRSYVYFDIQFKMGKTIRGLNEKVTKTLDWQAAGRLPL